MLLAGLYSPAVRERWGVGIVSASGVRWALGLLAATAIRFGHDLGHVTA